MLTDLHKLTNAVTGVHNKLSKNQHSNEKDSKSSDEKGDANSSKFSNSKENNHHKDGKSPIEKNDVEKLKEENTNLKKGMYEMVWIPLKSTRLPINVFQ